MRPRRARVVMNAIGHRRVVWKWPYEKMYKGRTFEMRGTVLQIASLRSALSRHARLTGKVFTTNKLKHGRIRVKRWL